MSVFANLRKDLRRIHIVLLGLRLPGRAGKRTMPGGKTTFTALICLGLVLLMDGTSRSADEGEFSPAMLAYKIRLLERQFEQTESKLLLQTGTDSKTKKLELEDVSNKIKSIEAEFQAGTYYPDLLDEHIVLVQEELQQILTDGRHTVPADSESENRTPPAVSIIEHAPA